jgi:hypothetical protein
MFGAMEPAMAVAKKLDIGNRKSAKTLPPPRVTS